MEITAGIFTILGIIIGWFITFWKFRLERKDKFRMAAIEKRLEAHQKAYAQCMIFVDVINEHNGEKVKIIFEDARTFYTNYSLYLEKGTRKKFVETLGFINAFCPRWDYLKNFEPNQKKEELERFHRESQKVFDLAKIIQKEVELEPLVESTWIKQKIRSKFDDVN